MPKRAIIVHRWDGTPEADWYPWLRRELEKKKFLVDVPEMPDTAHPRIEKWVPFLKKHAGKVNENTFFIGHSVGCQTIIRYLQDCKSRVGGAVLVAGWLSLNPLETDEEKQVAGPWIETPPNFAAAKKSAKKFTAIFSDNDPYVPLKYNADMFKEKLGAKIVIEKQKGHFTADEGVTKLPVVLKELLKMA